MKKKFKEWLKRYGIPLTLSTISAIIAANLVKILTHNNITAGFFGTWADNAVFYGYLAATDLKKERITSFKNSFKEFFRLIRNMVVEFGPGEYLDSFILRPFFLSAFPYFFKNYSLAILFGGLTADISFFIPTIISYETRKKLFKD